MNLYTITEQLRTIAEAIEMNQGELTAELEADLDRAEGDLRAKADNIAALVAELEAEAGAMEDEATRLLARAGVRGRAAGHLKSYLKRAMEAVGSSKIRGDRFDVSVCKNGQPSIVWTGAGEPPEGFRRVIVVPDMDAARKALKRGELPEGFEAKHGTHLRIR